MKRLSLAISAALLSSWAIAQTSPGQTDAVNSPPDSSLRQSSDPTGTDYRAMSPEDQRATQELNARLTADPKHYFRHVKVTVHDGVARLSGFVDSSDAIYKAQEIARGAPGITKVDNQMKVERNGNNASQPD